MKPRLIYDQPGTLLSDWIKPVFDQYVDFAPIDIADYRSGDCYFTTEWNNTADHWAQLNRPVVLCLLSEPGAQAEPWLRCHVMQSPAWYWYQESLWYRSWQYHNYVPEPNFTHLALMPMGLQKFHRDYVVAALGDNLDRFVWSYVERERQLPNDMDLADHRFQRYFNPDWYNSTAMSLVVETTVFPGSLVVSEKTFKAMAFQHPFVVVGQPGHLNLLHELGFETFENIFDESYDQIDNWKKRCDAALATALNYTMQPRDKITQQKIAHNHQRFFDQDLVKSRIHKEIIEPLLEYAKA